ncbi:hypothetical protein AB0I98_28560 [Streptomyces sp. NPDC050211]|uniref:hypothetical protein n=1 Tax=Streptomyces sp. NPDC050211 TaxID=3154932 RepID=UPI003439AB4B
MRLAAGPRIGLATRWDWHPRPDEPGKTVWAEYTLPASPSPWSVGCGAYLKGFGE